MLLFFENYEFIDLSQKKNEYVASSPSSILITNYFQCDEKVELLKKSAKKRPSINIRASRVRHVLLL
ncbi:hypothetical protein Glove_279g11 [Diversispora epigaea]|uniref:Uncharacterized protein n=1 Tax=Diversispora epigaea TaxID=1348612 RepID=A0A397I2J3_9GLOM|nr:hypothetical protein Glove_279g11 [Diversispora epigaea]